MSEPTNAPIDTGNVHPPGSSWRARQLAKRALAPVERFLAIEASSGILLLVAAIAALVWANSPWRAAYFDLWHTPIGLTVGPFQFQRDLHFWINEGLMTIFFFVVGLEIRLEMHRGELSEVRKAALPVAAAIGGMLLPACIFWALNQGRESVTGWGIPMATDIAFAVGVLALLGKRVPPELRVLLLALAVIDDVGAIVVIALFYSSGLAVSGLQLAAAGLGVNFLMRVFGVKQSWAYVVPSLVAWAGTYQSGVHPTIAGVVVGLMTPVQPWFGRSEFSERANASIAAVREQDGEHGVLPHLDRLNEARKGAVSAVERLQHALHGWVAFGIMPLFALANAGIPIGNATLSGDSMLVFLGVSAGLVLGKPLGILGVSWLAVRFGIATLPRGVRWAHVGLVGVVGGIGFTMAIFIAQLAFPAGAHLETAKLAILVASGLAGAAAWGLGKVLLASTRKPADSLAEREPEGVT